MQSLVSLTDPCELVLLFSELSDPTVPRLSCQEAGKVWSDGPALLASLQRATFEGVTGQIALEGQARQELR
jgi:hypothetical protein